MTTHSVDLVIAAEVASLKALAAAGRRARLPRSQTDRTRGIPEHAVHTRVRIAAHREQCDRLLAGAWGALRVALSGRMPAADIDALITACDEYVRDLILAGSAFERAQLCIRLTAVQMQDAGR